MTKQFAIPAILVSLSALFLTGCSGSSNGANDQAPTRKSANGDKSNLVFVDLQSSANQSLAGPFDGITPGNDLSQLPTGQKQFGPTTFNIQQKMLQLGNPQKRNKPRGIVGIEVNHRFKKLHIFHGTGVPGASDRFQPVPDGTQVGMYVVHYEDKETLTIPVVYGYDLRDWWNWDNSKKVHRAHLAWVGKNADAQRYKKSIRLYASTWKNSFPEKMVTTIDFHSTQNTNCELFCVAMTAETQK